MKHKIRKTEAYLRKTRDRAGKLKLRIRTPKMPGGRFDAVAYAAALEVLG